MKWLQLNGPRFINLDRVAGIEFSPTEEGADGKKCGVLCTGFGYNFEMEYNQAYLFFGPNDGKTPTRRAITLMGRDAKILAAYFDQYRER